VPVAESDESPARLKPSAAMAMALVAGALSGAFIAWGDFGAMWLWLPLWRDRAGLMFRLLTTLVPASALLVSIVAGLAIFAARKVESMASEQWRPFAAPLLLGVLSAWPLHVLAVRLMSGGSMSALPAHDAIVLALSMILPFGAFVFAWGLLRVSHWMTGHDRRLHYATALCLGVAFALGKINQTVLPNLYEYLHHGLACVAWGVASIGSWSFLRTTRGARIVDAANVAPRPWVLAAACALALVANALTLDLNLNVRVAMFDARCATSRALLSAGNPVLRWIERGHGRTRTAQGLTHGARDTTGLATQPGAHVLLITIDALRADHLGSYGYTRPVSPELDAIAKQGTQFDRVYAQAPHSSYSLSSLMTSEYIHEVVELTRPLPTATLATTLRDQGYHTAAFFTDGIFHTEGKKLGVYRDNAFGFALFDHTNRESEDQTVRVLQEADRIRDNGEQPSFLWVHYFDVHEPYQETTYGTGEMDRYDSEIRHVDREVGRLMKGLRERFKRDIVLAVTADHGEEFRDHGGVYHGSTLYEEQVRVPLIVSAKALPKKRFEAPVEVVDIAPTLLGIVGVEPAPSMRGRDLRVFATGRERDPGPVFSAVLTKRMAVRWPYKVIADLRFGLFELYDLSQDPHERKNLANLEGTRLAEMKDLVYAWLDSLEHEHGARVAAPANDWSRELRWGRLGDRRAVEPMSRLLLDQSSPKELRIEAGQILAKLADTSCAPALLSGLSTKPPEVAAEAAIALGRMYDDRARSALKPLVHVEDPFVRARAAVSLGRLRDKEAVPALIDALWVAPTQYEREEAVRWLGRLRDRRAVEPLLQILPEFNLRYLTSVALGQIGDVSAYPALAAMIGWEHHTNIRDEVVRGLGLLGDKRAIPLLMGVLAKEPELKNTAESLIRLGALEGGHLGGIDASSKVKGAAGFERCEAGPLYHDWDYLQRTWCVARGSRLTFRLPTPTQHARWTSGAVLVIRMRRVDAVDPASVKATLAGREVATQQVDTNWIELRVTLDPGAVPKNGKLELTSSPAEARLGVDHVLLVPRDDALAAAP